MLYQLKRAVDDNTLFEICNTNDVSVIQESIDRAVNWTNNNCMKINSNIAWSYLIQYVTCNRHVESIVKTSKEPVCPRVELILKIIIILLIIFLGFIKGKPC